MGGGFDIAGKEARAAELDELTAANDFWQDQGKAQAILKERASLADVIAQHVAEEECPGGIFDEAEESDMDLHSLGILLQVRGHQLEQA